MNINIFLSLFVGIILTSLSWSIDNKIASKNCVSTKLKSANKLVFIMGIMLITSSISFFICFSKCNTFSKSSEMMSMNFFVFFVFFIGIMNFILGLIVYTEAKKECDDAKQNSVGIFLFGLILCLGSTLYFLKDKINERVVGAGARAVEDKPIPPPRPSQQVNSTAVEGSSFLDRKSSDSNFKFRF